MFDVFVSPHEAKPIGTLLEDIRCKHGAAAIGLGSTGLCGARLENEPEHDVIRVQLCIG